jgi:hypothetical protein
LGGTALRWLCARADDEDVPLAPCPLSAETASMATAVVAARKRAQPFMRDLPYGDPRINATDDHAWIFSRAEGQVKDHGRRLIGTSVLNPHVAALELVKFVLDFSIAHRPVEGRKIAGSVLPSPS